jgi:hypothetical protein
MNVVQMHHIQKAAGRAVYGNVSPSSWRGRGGSSLALYRKFVPIFKRDAMQPGTTKTARLRFRQLLVTQPQGQGAS